MDTGVNKSCRYHSQGEIIEGGVGRSHYVGRMADNRWAKKCTEWIPYGMEAQQRKTKKRRRDEITETADE